MKKTKPLIPLTPAIVGWPSPCKHNKCESFVTDANVASEFGWFENLNKYHTWTDTLRDPFFRMPHNSNIWLTDWASCDCVEQKKNNI